MADRSETLKLIISGDGRRLRTSLQGSEREIRGFASRSTKIIRGMERRLLTGLRRTVMNPVAGLLGGAGILAAGKQILDFDDKLASLRVQAELSAKETLALRQTIISAAEDSRQPWNETLAAVSNIVDKTGDLNLAATGIRGIGIAAKATSSDIGDIASVTNALNMNLKITGDQIMDAFGILASQGKTGSYVFSEMAGDAERLFAAASQLDLSGLEDLKKYGAFLQMIRPSFGSSEEASTMVKNIMTRIKTQAKLIKKDLKFDVFNDDGSLKEFDTIIKGIVSGAGGDTVKLYKIFQEASIAFTQFNRELNDGKGFEKFESFLKTAGKDQLWTDFLIKADTGKSKVQLLANTFRRFTDTALGKSIDTLSYKMDRIIKDPDKMREFQENLDNIATSISNLANLAVELTPLVTVVGALVEGVMGSERLRKSREAYKEFKQLPKEEQKLLRPLIRGNDWNSGTYSVLEKYKKGQLGDLSQYNEEKIVADFNALPIEERKRRIENLNRYGDMSLKNENRIDMTVNIDSNGNVSSRTNSLDTTITARASRGPQNARR